MAGRLAALLLGQGRTGRGVYVLVGVTLFAVKHNIDRFVATLLFERRWSLFNYLVVEEPTAVAGVTPEVGRLYATLATIALPFVWVGVALTLRRLRDVGLAPGWVVLFFVPFLNLIFFILLSVLPSADTERPAAPVGERTTGTWIPDHPLGSAGFALLATLPVALATVILGVQFLVHYGWGVFVGVPFVVGLAAALLHGYHRPRTLAQCLGVAWLAIALLAAGLVALAVEGIVCLAMAAPIGFVLASLGASIGYAMQRRVGAPVGSTAALVLIGAALPVLMGAEAAAQATPALYDVTTVMTIEAGVEEVWRHVVSFAELPPPSDWLFATGIAYPIRAEIQGRGVGAVRRCVFSTEAFIEPIEIWDEPRLLHFTVAESPAPMQEWTPYQEMKPPHLNGFLRSHSGQFRLVPLGSTRTRVEATTWYEHRLWPSFYWRSWSDFIIERIHARVLRHVKTVAEAG